MSELTASEKRWREHLIVGLQPESLCLVCERQISGSWTDYNGQIRCAQCGMTYQILGAHLAEDFLQKLGLTKAEVARRYCDELDMVELARAYRSETNAANRLPFGTYLGRPEGWNAPTREDYVAFNTWMESNHERLRAAFPDAPIDWMRVLDAKARRAEARS